ncbi:transcription factor grauzone-like isoform X2 [Wyeomyia smithii]|uniref:transcription factor grauzone-like isoform X2 n=1 Tax=Wyeomyia smithii TaxID=174621 RepID=UPI002467CA88|nr:transcription factor grauzone-like isoform X2 [Wyeomyia smithii]
MRILMHFDTVHGSQDGLAFKCDICGLGFDKEKKLQAHAIYHEKVQCSHCDKQLANKFVLKKHIIFKHQDTDRSKRDRQMICEVCGREFLNKICFDRHVQTHKGIEIERFQCQICLKWLKGERNFQQHLQHVHYEAGKSFICSICKQSYPNTRALYKHKSKVHVEEKYECEFCGRKFKQALYLKEHRATHTGERLYCCKFCDHTMNSKANLYVHMKKNHPVEREEEKQKMALEKFLVS